MKVIEKAEQVNLHKKEYLERLNIANDKPIFNSFVHCCSSAARKMIRKDPEQAVCTLLHIFEKFRRCPMKSYYIKKYFTIQSTNSKDISEYITRVGKMKTD